MERMEKPLNHNKMKQNRKLKLRIKSPVHKIFVKNVRKQIKKLVVFKNEEDGN